MTVKVSASEILKEVEEKEALLPTVKVTEKPLEQEQDLGNLLGWDENQINSIFIKYYQPQINRWRYKENDHQYLKCADQSFRFCNGFLKLLYMYLFI